MSHESNDWRWADDYHANFQNTIWQCQVCGLKKKVYGTDQSRPGRTNDPSCEDRVSREVLES
jgi:hypothetical protein